MKDIIITVFTPTYNRRETLFKLYQSLLNQTYEHFEWIIIDDGSTDGTKDEVNKWIQEDKIDIVYVAQSNNGKHIAMNRAVEIARGNYFTTVDSDDYLTENALKILLDAWNDIPEERHTDYISVKSNCFDTETGECLGPIFRDGFFDCNYLDARYRFKINAEMQSLSRIEALREYPNPNILGGPQNGGLRYYPETIWQDLAARKYITRFISASTCGYRRNSSESLLGRGKKYNRFNENIYLWKHIINDNFDYFLCMPKEFLKAFIGVTMDSLFAKKSISSNLKDLNSPLKRTVGALLVPAGYVAFLIKK